MNAEVQAVKGVPTWAFVVAMFVGALAMGGYLYIRSARMKKLKPFSELSDHQLVIDTLDLREIRDWTAAWKNRVAPGTKALFFYPTKKRMNGLGYSYPEGLDVPHHLVGMISDEKTGLLLRITLFSFNEMSSDLKSRLTDQSDVFAVEY